MIKKNKWLVFGLLSMCLFWSCRKEDAAYVTDDGEVFVDDSGVDNISDHDASSDYIWDSSDVIEVSLNGSNASSTGTGLTISGSKITISSAGNYSFSGTLEDGQIYVDTEEEAIVRLILNNIDLSCSDNAAIYINNAEKVMLVLADGTSNIVNDGMVYSSDEADANAAIFSKDDLTIYGEGFLEVNANYNDGITSKNGLIIASGNMTIDAIDDGIRGKDYLVINTGNIAINCGGDGLVSDNTEEEGCGYITINNGSINIVSDGDAVYAGKDFLMNDGELDLKSGGGSNANLSSDASAKSIKSGMLSQFYGGTINIDAADDGIHSDYDIEIYGGTFIVESGDDGMHSENELIIENASININSSVEGIEGGYIAINSGTINISATDDGMNATQGTEVMNDDGSQLIINGGTITVNASGNDVDALDSNGDITINGGLVKLYIPTSGPAEGLDANGSVTIDSEATVYVNDVIYTSASSGGSGGH